MSDRILSAFTSGERELYGILIAQMLSGKSGTYYRLALEAVHRGFFESACIICGSRDTALRDQTKEGLLTALDTFCEEKDLRHSEGKRLERSINVYWNQEQKGVKVGDNCLVINDESHTAQSKSNNPFKHFWSANDLTSCLHGDFSVLIERNIRVLSVSATSFSECVENQKVSLGLEHGGETGVELSEKNVFIMDPGTTYKGVSDFLENGQIKFTAEPISEKTKGKHLCSVLSDKKYDRKYCLVRTSKGDKDEPLMRIIARKTGTRYMGIHGTALKVLDYQGNKINPLKFLSDPPTKTTIVHICGAFRMGQVLDKTHIGFVYEQSSSPQIDTLLQGLLGRVCGHNANMDIDIYVSKSRKKEVEQYASAVKLSSEECIEAFSKFRPALNVKAGGNKHTIDDTIKDKSGNFWRKMIPIKFPYSMFGNGFDNRDITHIDLHQLFLEHPELIEDNPDKQFIMSELESPNNSGRISNRDLSMISYVQRGTAQNLDRAIEKGERNTDWFTNVVWDNDTVVPFTVLYNKSKRDNVYLIGFSPNKTMNPLLWKKLMGLNDTLKKCNYNPAHVVTTETGKKIQNVNGGQVIRFPQETSNSEVELHKHLREAIIRSQQNPLAQKEITSLWCDADKSYKGIRLYKNVFNQEMILDVKSKLDSEFNIDIKFRSNGKWNENPDKPYYRYNSISW